VGISHYGGHLRKSRVGRDQKLLWWNKGCCEIVMECSWSG
jgi:hypothetical protein